MSRPPPIAHVLLVDASGSTADRQALRGRLEAGGFEVALATCHEAVRLLRESPPELVVLSGAGDEADALLAEAKRLRESDAFVPVLAMLAASDVATRVRLLRSGADDCLELPLPDEELVARAEALLRIKRIQDRMHRSRRELQRLSITDALTGVLNRKHLEDRCRDELKRARRYRDPLSLLVVDLDGFSAVNETFGEEVGSEVLRALARILEEVVRDVDLVGRLSADTFCLLLPSTHMSGALTVAERVVASVSDHPLPVGGQSVPVTVSVGLAFFPSREISTHDDLLRLAREALFRARQAGPGRIGLYQGAHYTYQPEVDGEPGV